MNAIIEKGKVRVTFDYDAGLVTKVRTLPNRKYDPTDHSWTATATEKAIKQLELWGFTITGKAEKKPLKCLKSPMPLFPYQVDGLNFIEEKEGRCLIGDEMGLGKTIQALAWLEEHPELRPALIVCPASLKFNWEAEANK